MISMLAELVGVKSIDKLPAWVPRIIGLERAPEGGAIVEVSTLRQPIDSFNFGHESCEYCSYKLTQNLEAPGRFNPHMFDTLTLNPDRKSVAKHCRCTCVHEYVCAGEVYRYTVRVNRMLDSQMSLMRQQLRNGETLDAERDFDC
jgi:hypothetical protein